MHSALPLIRGECRAPQEFQQGVMTCRQTWSHADMLTLLTGLDGFLPGL